MDIQIQGYDLIEELHKSQRSLIYRGIQNKDGLSLIFKVLNSRYPTAEEVGIFKNSFQIVKDLKIPGVNKVYELIKYKNTFIILQEDIKAKDLVSVFYGPIPIDVFLGLAIRVAGILDDIHRENVIHGEINPQNIIWNKEINEVRIIDFGMAVDLRKENQNVNIASIPYQSLAYISPEQTGRMNRGIDYRTDYYSLGMTFYRLLTGYLPFQAEDTSGWIHSHIADTPIYPSEINSDVPDQVSDIVMKLVSKNPDDRYKSCQGLIFDLTKCLKQLKRNKRIDPFTLAEKEIPTRIQISPKVYGRNKERNVLFNTFNKVVNGSNEIIMISGCSGIGKTALVDEIYKPIVENQGFFVKGKFDQFHKNVPYSAIIQAFTDLVGHLLCESDERLSYWQDQIKKAVSTNGQIILDIIPELATIIGKQPEVPAARPREAKNRFRLTFQNFVKVFAKKQHPLVIFFDDLQWADESSLSLIEYLTLSKQLDHLFIIGAYRNNEIDDKHLLTSFFKKISKRSTSHNLMLTPLTKSAVIQLLEDTFSNRLCSSRKLSEIVFSKTQGNPLFIKTMINSFFEEKFIRFDLKKNKWIWEINNINNLGISGDVVNYMINDFNKLSPETIHMLCLASCLGNKFDLETLAIICDSEPGEIFKHLNIAIEKRIIVPLVEASDYIDLSGVKVAHVFRQFKFQHDHLQQVAYSLIEPKKLLNIHHQIAQRLKAGWDDIKKDQKIDELVSHLNEARFLIKDHTQLIELVKVNLRAAQKALSSIAYFSAYKYLTISLEVFRTKIKNNWQLEPDLSFEVYKEYVQCSYLCGRFDEAEQYMELLLNQSLELAQKIEIYYLKIYQYTERGKVSEAVKASQEGLALLGIKIPKNPSKLSLLRELFLVKWRLRGKEISYLENRAEIKDPEATMIMKLLIELLAPAYIVANTNLFVYVALRSTNLALKYGNSAESAVGFGMYGVILSTLLGEFDRGLEMGELSLRISEKYGNEFSSRLLYAYTIFIRHWSYHWKTLPEYFKTAVEIGKGAGDMLYTGHACIDKVQWDINNNLEDVIKNGTNDMEFIRENKDINAFSSAKILQQFRLNLLGLTEHRLSYDGPVFNEQDFIHKIKKQNYILGIGTYYYCKIQTCFIYEDYGLALSVIKEGSRIRDALLGTPYYVEYQIFRFLTISTLLPGMKLQDRISSWYLLKRIYRLIKKCSQHCPTNFLHHKFLMEAEMARISGKKVQVTMTLYSQAVEAARNNDYLKYEALCNEQAAKFYLGIGQEKIAGVYLKEAYYLYCTWGAKAKVKYLEEIYSELLNIGTDEKQQNRLGLGRGELQLNSEMLDFNTVMNVSQAISQEINSKKIVEKLMAGILEISGAERGLLIVRDDRVNKFFLVAEYQMKNLKINDKRVNQQNIVFKSPIPITEYKRFSLSIINYVIRTRETVLLHSAYEDKNCYFDEYIKEHRAKSILCVPIIYNNQLKGAMFLDNNLATNVFTEKRVVSVKILASQTAISLENSTLFVNLERKVDERTKELNKLNQDLKQANEEVKNLTHLISHEIKGPLYVIQGHIRFLYDKLKSNSTFGNIKERYMYILKECELLNTFVNNYLFFEKFQHGLGQFDRAYVSLKQIINDVVNRNDILRLEKRIEIKNLVVEERKVLGNKVQLEIAFNNIINNAIKYSPGDSSLTIEQKVYNNQVSIIISDQGGGIPKEVLDSLFNKFVHSQNQEQSFSSGLGLAITKQISEAHNGKISIHPKQQGTRVTIILPMEVYNEG